MDVIGRQSERVQQDGYVTMTSKTNNNKGFWWGNFLKKEPLGRVNTDLQEPTLNDAYVTSTTDI
jgi:hypothetical protein